MSDTTTTLNDTISFFSYDLFEKRKQVRRSQNLNVDTPVFNEGIEIVSSEIKDERERFSLSEINLLKEKLMAEIELLSVNDVIMSEQGIELPNDFSIEYSMELLNALIDNNLVPSRITQSAEEGVCFVFNKSKYTLYIEIYNDQELGLIIENFTKKEIIKNIEVNLIEDFIKEVNEFNQFK